MAGWNHFKRNLFSLVLIYGCTGGQGKKDYTKDADPMIGTGGHGHTFSGGALPFGMVQLSLDTRGENWDGSSGYYIISDPTIIGFTHTHLSGTGAPEYCDVLLMRTTGSVQLQAGDEQHPESGYRSEYRHDQKNASAGYYSVLLDDYHIRAELTATTRTGMHRYTYPESGKANIIIDLKHRDRVIDSYIEFVDNTTIRGLRRSTGWKILRHSHFLQ